MAEAPLFLLESWFSSFSGDFNMPGGVSASLVAPSAPSSWGMDQPPQTSTG